MPKCLISFIGTNLRTAILVKKRSGLTHRGAFQKVTVPCLLLQSRRKERKLQKLTNCAVYGTNIFVALITLAIITRNLKKKVWGIFWDANTIFQ